MKRIFDTCLDNKEQASLQIEFPIVAYLACDDPHEVSLALKRYLRKLNVKIPSELCNIEGLDQRALAVLLLRVFTPEVIDSLNDLSSVEKVESEQLVLLNWITKHAPNFDRVAETEILRVTQHAQLREALEKIEGGLASW